MILAKWHCGTHVHRVLCAVFSRPLHKEGFLHGIQHRLHHRGHRDLDTSTMSGERTRRERDNSGMGGLARKLIGMAAFGFAFWVGGNLLVGGKERVRSDLHELGVSFEPYFLALGSCFIDIYFCFTLRFDMLS